MTAADVAMVEEAEVLAGAARLLGGARVLERVPKTRLDVHARLREGLPTAALRHLVEALSVIDVTRAMEPALGMSLRTYQRHRERAKSRLSPEQSGRAWTFAETLARATSVLGSQAEAERWLERPAIALDGLRPIDLVATPVGSALVADLLGRMEFGVYT